MMSISIAINGKKIHRVAVVNRGPVGGADGASYERGDGPDGGGLRRYEWRLGRATGEVLHTRSSGALRLAEYVCADIVETLAAAGREGTPL